MNGLWDVIFAQQASEECFGCLSITVFLQEDVKHSALFIHRPPEPVFDSTNDNMHLIQMPPGTPSGFPVTQFLSEERRFRLESQAVKDSSEGSPWVAS